MVLLLLDLVRASDGSRVEPFARDYVKHLLP